MKIVVFDFEVFRYDTLLGAIEITSDGKKIFQRWDLEEIKQFYFSAGRATGYHKRNQFIRRELFVSG